VEPEDILAAIPLFEVLGPEDRALLAAKSRFAYFPEGALLMEEGDFGTSMFALAEGEVAVAVTDARGAVQHVADLTAGDVVGEMSLMTGSRRSATVTAVTSVTALEITKVALEAILAHSPQLLDRFGPVLEARLAELDRIMAESAKWHIFGRTGDQLVAEMRRFFGAH
jgi:CRP-like cAMP-binding protein